MNQKQEIIDETRQKLIKDMDQGFKYLLSNPVLASKAISDIRILSNLHQKLNKMIDEE